MEADTCNSITWEVEARESGVQGPPQLTVVWRPHYEVGYMKPTQKKKKKAMKKLYRKILWSKKIE